MVCLVALVIDQEEMRETEERAAGAEAGAGVEGAGPLMTLKTHVSYTLCSVPGSTHAGLHLEIID